MLSDFNETWIFLDEYSKNAQNFMKIRHVKTELFHVDERTDTRTDRHDEAHSRFSKFYERA